MATPSSALLTPSTAAVSSTGISVANPNLDGTGPCALLFSAPSSGARVDWVHIQALGATTAGMIRLYLGVGGAPTDLIAEIPVAAVTPSGTVKAWSWEFFPPSAPFGAQIPLNALNLAGGGLPKCLWVSTQNAEAFRVIAFGVNY